MSIGTNRLVCVDLLRIVGAFLVITLHSDPLRPISMNASIVMTQGITRIAVPFFFVASGYFLAKTIKKGRFKPWAARIFKLYIVWMLIYSPIWIYHLLGENLLVLGIAKMLAIGHYHLWYLIALLLAALFLFLLIVWKRERLISAFIVLGFLLGFGLQYFYLYGPEGIATYVIKDGFLNRSFFTFAFPYLGIGYLIATRTEFVEVLGKNAILLLLLGGAILALEVVSYIVFAERQGSFDNLISMSLLAPTIFAIALKTRLSLGKAERFLGPLSLAIYLVHSGVLSTLYRVTDFGGTERWALTCVISFIIGAILIHPKFPLRWLVS